MRSVFGVSVFALFKKHQNKQEKLETCIVLNMFFQTQKKIEKKMYAKPIGIDNLRYLQKMYEPSTKYKILNQIGMLYSDEIIVVF